VPPPRVLGVDDWARKRGCTYGTILIDQERHAVVDLLPERTATALAAWLQEHPGVEILCRDRAGAYADGARRGAPGAIQVADRWHILVNLREALERLLMRKHAAVRAAADDVLSKPSSAPPMVDGPTTTPTPAAADHPARGRRDQRERRARRIQRFEAVRALHEQGIGVHQIARTLGIGRNTVRRFLRAEGFPERQPRRPCRTFLTPYEPYLRVRWDAGCRNISVLWREVRARGYAGGYSGLYAHLIRWRDQVGPMDRSPSSTRRFSVRQATWLLLRDPDELDPFERTYLEALSQRCPEAACARGLARSFVTMVRDRDQTALVPWMEQAERSDLPELRGFAAGLRRDWAAVTAGLDVPWSNEHVA
jgi:transposase